MMGRKHVFEITFIAILLSLGVATFAALCVWQDEAQTDIFFADPNNTFMDFFNVVQYVSAGDPYHAPALSPAERAYPPLAYLVYYPFAAFGNYREMPAAAIRTSQFGVMSVVVFIFFTNLLFSLLLYELKNGRKAIRLLTVFALFVSGISLFSLERGNVVYLSVTALLFFLMFYRSENKIWRELACIALAVAAGVKGVPALFGVLLLYEKRWGQACRTIVYGILAFILPFLCFKGGLSNLGIMLENVSFNANFYLQSNPLYKFGFIAAGILAGFRQGAFPVFLQIGYALALVCLLTAWSLNKPWKTILALTCALLLTPVNSTFYNGLYLFIPIVLFLNTEEHSRMDWFYLALMLLMLNPYQIRVYPYKLTYAFANLSTILVYLILCAEGTVRSILLLRQHLRARNLRATL